MRKWNIVGLILLLAVVVLTIRIGTYHVRSIPLLALAFLSIIPIGVDRWFKQLTAGALLWFGYWMISAFYFLVLAAALVVDMDTGYSRPGTEILAELLIYVYLGAFAAFGISAIVNLINFFVKIFSKKQKLEN